MSTSDPVAVYAAYECALSAALGAVLAGELGVEQTAVERQVVEALGALVWLLAAHRVDGRGRCRVCCRSRWRRRSVCTVLRALALHVRVSGWARPVASGAAAPAGERTS